MTEPTGTLLKQFLFLNRLRESGKINMWAASEPLEQAYDIPAKEATATLVAWMEWVTNKPSNRDK